MIGARDSRALVYRLLSSVDATAEIEWAHISLLMHIAGMSVKGQKGKGVTMLSAKVTKMRKKTYYRVLNDLAEWGLIDYKKGKNRYTPSEVRLLTQGDGAEKKCPTAELPVTGGARQHGKKENAPTGKSIKAGKRDRKCLSEREGTKEYAELVFLKEAEYGKLVEEGGQGFAERCVKRLSLYKQGVKGAEEKYKNDYAVICTWVKKAIKKEDEDGGQGKTRGTPGAGGVYSPVRKNYGLEGDYDTTI